MTLLRSRRSSAAAIGVSAFVAALGASAFSALAAESIDNGTQVEHAQAFIGSWRLLSFEARTAEGQVIFPFGPDADGVLTYTPDGRMSGAIWKANRQPFTVGDQQKGTPEEYTAAVQSYIQYLGTFEVDRDAGTVSHHVEQSIFPNWSGTTQTRYFEFSDHKDTLELTTPSIKFGGTTLVAAVVWERI